MPDGVISQALYFRGGNTTDELITVVLMRDGVPMRYFPIGAKGDVHVPLRVVEDIEGGSVVELQLVAAARASAAPSSSTSGWWSTDDGHRLLDAADGTGAGADDARRRLVVIGNGMAGARTVEEILARGGAEQFAITMFGDEPYGNYNRIMLSHVLSGEETDDDIFLNSLEWYVENDITLHAGVRVNRIDRFAKVVFSDDGQVTPYDQLIIATGSRSFMPPMDGLYDADGGAAARACSPSAPSTTPAA